ncbi:2Fe-2S iron-sulfur cluster-binding protein [Alsobacter sp. R-9]
MTHRVHIRGANADLDVGSGTTVLAAALAAGIAYPHGCRSGRCGACKTRLLSGEVALLRHTPFALTDQEKQAGLILACRAEPRSDCSVTWLDALEQEHTVRDEWATVTGLEDLTHDIRLVRLVLQGVRLAFSAGQYAELAFPGCPSRFYSMANVAGVEELEFHIRRVPGGRASGFVATQLAVGDQVHLRGPLGHSQLRQGHAGPIIAVAGGSGLAPIASIVETALASGMRQLIRVYFGVRGERDLYAEDRFRTLVAAHPNLTFTPVLSEEFAPGRRAGLVTQAIAEDGPDLRGAKAYLAGPPVMVEAATALLLACGLPPSDIHADAFFTTIDQSMPVAEPAPAP